MRTIAAIVALLAASAAFAQVYGYRNRRELPLRTTMAECLQDADVQEILQLDLDQRLLLRSLRAAPPQHPLGSGATKADMTVAFTPELLIFDRLDRALLPEQRLRLRQIAVRRVGLFAPLQTEVAQDLRLDAEQKASLEKMAGGVREKIRDIFNHPPTPPKPGATTMLRLAFADRQRHWSASGYYRAMGIRQRGLAAMIASLRPEQRQRWVSLAGRPYVDRFMHPSATLQAEVWRRLGSIPGENPALSEARLRMRTAEERASLQRECLRRAGAAALLFPETARRLGLTFEASERVYLALTSLPVGAGVPPEPESFLLPIQVKVWRTMVAP